MDHGHDMPGMGGMTPSSTMNNTNSTGGGMMMHHHKMMMHMTFFWGENAEILFSGWPGARTGMYVLALIFVFVLSFLVEWLSHSRLIKPGSPHVTAGLIQTLLHTMRVGLAYLVMLAVMSFNGGVFLVAVAGHCLGFLIFGSRVFKKTPPAAKTSDLPPMSC
ncbi:copper transporter 1 [Ricinus communis]|uniref:copper transporter 1 n=1 Tax=Ricinus communis TaxID=3988 RepID=UPI0007723A9F|nr:copper transporter 1 [Ricinus communis]|eukprot:XP_015575496.1 copper transporter 1 [Ricinus communis]